ncbi:MAG: sialidase family protein, partial [Candidatus Zixiibacteriota bacterium]
MSKKLVLSGVFVVGVFLLAASISFAGQDRFPTTLTSSPGYQVGITHYDYQTSGSSGNRIVKDPLGGIHLYWTNAPERWNRQRHVYYNFRDESGSWQWTGGLQVNMLNGAGFTTMDLLSDCRAVVVYHNVDAGLFLVAAVDAGRGFGNFTEYYPPDYIPNIGFFGWPYVAVDGQNRIHQVSLEVQFFPSGLMDLMYTRSSDGGNTWTDPVSFDSTLVYGHNIAASPVDDKVAIVYNRPFIDDPIQAENEVSYIESEDGVNWNWGNKVNITNYEFDTDSIVAYTDNDVIYDNEGKLHIVWNTSYVNRFGWIQDHAWLFHWSEETGITQIVNHSQWKFPGCRPGSWNLSFAKMSLGVDADNDLFLVYTRFD